jgi:transglutaminase-like putative cysteine protease
MSAATVPPPPPALRIVLTAIVLANLAFVHVTEDASLSWLLPMYVATLASPWLARLASTALYRWLWNGVVVAIFAVLVHHTSIAGARYLLEDGLRLAALCQVHVVCTLGQRQKPDLLFFNSFLVAVVTAFLTQDLPYLVVFLAFAPLFVLGLSLYAAQRTRAPAAVVRAALVHAALALGITAVLFTAWPRDFHRRGLVVESLALSPGAQSLDVAFTPEVRLGQRGEAASSDALVLRVRIVAGEAAKVPSYWRGATQAIFDGQRWRAWVSGRLGDARWSASGARALVRPGAPGGAVVDVLLADPSGGRAFLPLNATHFEFTTEQQEHRPTGLADGTLQLAAADAARARDAEYRVELAGPAARRGGRIVTPPPAELAPVLTATSNEGPEVVKLATSLRAALPADAEQHEIVERMRAHLAARRDYLPPGSASGALDVEAFVSGRAGGHCEYFATALVLLLRHEGIPCRLVTGYSSDDWDERMETLTIRRRDAHAWVEVKDPQAGWYTVDPTPPGARAARMSQSLFAAARLLLSRWWEEVVRFDDDARGNAVAWCAALPRRIAALATKHPGASGGAAALVALLVLLARWRRARSIPAEVRAYRACLRRLHIAPLAGETPRALLARASRDALPGAALTLLAGATRRHEHARYAMARPSPRR